MEKRTFVGAVGKPDMLDHVVTLTGLAKVRSPETWKNYRSAMMAVYRPMLGDLATLDSRKPREINAFAILICLTSPIFVDERNDDEKPRGRAKWLQQKWIDELFRHLESEIQRRTGDARAIAAQALTFARVTLGTGVRPIEWANAQLRPAVEDDFPGDYVEGWYLLKVQTAKQKAARKHIPRTREILIRGELVELVQLHLANYRAQAERVDVKCRKPEAQFAVRSSRQISEASERLWPGEPERRAALYTFRGQARADFTRWFGAEIAAVLLGHGFHTGQNHYPGERRSNDKRGPGQREGLDLFPSKSACQEAADSQARRSGVSRKGVDEGEPLDAPGY